MISRRVILTATTISIVVLYYFTTFKRVADIIVDDLDSDDLESKTLAEQPLSNHINLRQTGPSARFMTINRVRQNILEQNEDNESKVSASQQEDSSYRGFETCRMATCFDFSNCPADKPLKVNIAKSRTLTKFGKQLGGESNFIHEKILNIIRNSRFYEPQASKACLYVLEDDTLDRDPLSPSFHPELTKMFGPENRYGMNHLVFNLYSGSWPEYRVDDFAGLQMGAAIIAKASNSILKHRPGFDISIPLFSHLHTERKLSKSIVDQIAVKRRYFITFKGKRYVFGNGSVTRNNLYHIDNDKDVIMLTTCRHGKKWQDMMDERCDEDEMRYELYNFEDLMRESTFCLTPRGRRLGSFRFIEALNHSCVPVVLSNGWVWPFDDIIDWSRAALQIDESWLMHMPDFLKDMDPSVVELMRHNCRNLYDKYLSSIESIVLTTLQILEQRINNNINSLM